MHISILKTLLFLSFPILMHAQLTPTPFVDRGPLFPVNSEDARDNDLTEVGNENTTPEGTIADLKGTIFNIDGEVVPNAEVLIWQTDDRGIYDHPEAARMMGLKNVKLDPNFQYWGKTISDKDGNYYFKTIVPKPYLIGNFQRPAHIHFQVLHDGYKYLTTELHFPNDQYLDGDPVTEDLDENEHKLLMARITEPSEGTEVKEIFFNIVLNKKEQRDK